MIPIHLPKKDMFSNMDFLIWKSKKTYLAILLDKINKYSPKIPAGQASFIAQSIIIAKVQKNTIQNNYICSDNQRFEMDSLIHNGVVDDIELDSLEPDIDAQGNISYLCKYLALHGNSPKLTRAMLIGCNDGGIDRFTIPPFLEASTKVKKGFKLQ